MVKLVDTLVLEASALGVRVRVSPSAPSLGFFMIISEHINTKLQQHFKPLHLSVVNESALHHVPKGSESHFRIELVSAAFEPLSLLQRHRAVNSLLAKEFELIKACSLHLFTPAEWEAKNGLAEKSPRCVG